MAYNKGIQRRKELFDVAARMFAKKGYTNTSIRDIAEALGIQKSSLYHYFENKEHLLYQMLDAYMTEALAEIQELLARPLSPVQRLKGVLGLYGRVYASDRDRLVLLVNEIDSLGPANRGALIEKERKYVAAIQGVLSDLAQQGLMKDIPLPVATFAFFSMVHYTIKWYDPDGPIGPERLSRYFLEILTHGILKPVPDQ